MSLVAWRSAPSRSTLQAPVKPRRVGQSILLAFALVLGATVVAPVTPTEAASPRIVVSPAKGQAGTRVVVRGYNMPRRSRIQILWNGRFKGFPTAWVNRYGSFRVTITVPSVAPNLYKIKAVSVLSRTRKVVTRSSQLGRTRAAVWFRVTPTLAGSYPSQTTLSSVPITSLARPGYLARVVDPTWGTTVTRVSSSSGIRQAYSRIPAWNSNQTKILLGFTYPGRMLDGTTYADLGSFSQVSQAIWANTDPNRLFGQSGNTLVSQNATTGVRTTLRAFTAYSSISIGDYEGGVDDNDAYVALIGTTSGGARHLITYNIASNTIVADIVAPSNMDNAQISRKGNYVVVVGGGYTRRYTRDLSSYITLSSNGYHGDNALDASGNEIYVANNAPYVVSYSLSSGASRQLLSGPTAFEYGHVSGRNTNRPGWVYLSNYDTAVTIGRTGRDQVVAVKTDGSGTVEVFGFAHHSNQTYASEPHAVPSPDGRRVMFASEWGGSEVYAYVTGMP
jgi:hypothetical protein